MGIMDKNRKRDLPSFANINMLGKCNIDCFFCLGKDIDELLTKQDQMKVHFTLWKNFDKFLKICKKEKVEKIYLTGQNTDPLLYQNLEELIEYIQLKGFQCGVRTNGFLAADRISTINKFDSVGYSVHTVNPITQKMINGKRNVPDWNFILKNTNVHHRVSIVINRCNLYEYFDTLKFLQNYPAISYIQTRRVSTDTREDLLYPDIKAYEELYTNVNKIFNVKQRLYEDAEIYYIYGMPVVFWRTVKTSVNSFNYFTDGTVSDEYFIVEGYLKNYEK